MEKIEIKSCNNKKCRDFGKANGNNMIEYASFDTQSGKKQRCRCKTCGSTISVNTGTVYFGLRCSRDEFDQVAQMRVEGLSISAISRITYFIDKLII